MPGIIADINKCSIEEDQFRVATQWAKTFVYNPLDLATQMTQLVMACVARGDFKVRDYMSSSSELESPSPYLTIVDYLSHASRIIIDYNSLSQPYIEELLSYFPEPSEANNVFSRSATHDVNQVKDKAVEGKGVMLGVKGQLPALLKTARDFGLNIAMGGLGQDNFQGKKISANGFSGHFYYHRNTEHKLLLAGLEQSAPTSFGAMLKSHEHYPETEQQGHDQFGQSHSLKGASDVYTAAGSLYFSSPVYQAKLVLEKGVFPPDKYGAMQVTITDEHWPLIKDFFGGLKRAAHSEHLAELRAMLCEKPATAKERNVEYKSYVALDFNVYLKQAYKVFIESSELPATEKANITLMQEQLLIHIKQLQFGTVAVYPAFEALLSQIRITEKIPEGYSQALIGISDLFKLQLSRDPKLENTQIVRPYHVGDYTWSALSKIHHVVRVEDGKQDYEFGDITWGLLNRANQKRKAYQLGDISYGLLSTVHAVVNGSEAEYRFGDITRGLWHRLGSSSSASESQKAQQEPLASSAPGYRLGDYPRQLFWEANQTGEQAQADEAKDKKDDEKPQSFLL